MKEKIINALVAYYYAVDLELDEHGDLDNFHDKSVATKIAEHYATVILQQHDEELIRELNGMRKDGLYLEFNSHLENDIKVMKDGIYNEAIDNAITLIKSRQSGEVK